jgi:hypothetical protein
MKSWNLIVRRTHLYLGMLLMPWLLVYGLSTLTLNHGDWFQTFRASEPQWLPLWEKPQPLTTPLQEGNGNLREVVRGLLDSQKLEGPFFAQQQGRRININVQNFIEPTRLTYDLDRQLLRAEKKKFTWVEVLLRLHFRAGYEGTGPLSVVWPIFVDLFCATLLIWIITGLILWWKVRDSRHWGWAAIGGGFLTIAVLLMTV